MKHCIIFLNFLFFAFNVSAQEMWGISNSNFSGNMGIFLNPSTIVGAPYQYEFNLVAADIFAQNTYIYIPQESNFIFRGIAGNIGDEKNLYDTYTSDPQKAFGHVLVIGPSYIRNYGKRAWGIHTAYRHEMSALDIPSGLAKFIYEKYDFAPLIGQSFSATPFSAAWLNWAELGGTFGMALVEQQENYLKVATTVNLLAGFNGLYLDGQALDFTVYDSSSAIAHRMDATIGHALAADGNAGASSFLAIRGYGLSTTLGATYIHHRNRGAFDCNKTSDRLKKYDYRIGFSLMDLGFIRFSNQAQVLKVATTTDRLWTRIDSIKFHSMAQLDTLLSTNINGVIYSAVDEPFSMYLPAAISIQFDYCFAPHIFGNATLVNRIHYSPKEVARGNQLDLSMRYEKKRWEVAGDVTLFEYNKPSVGIGFRYWIFVVGSDRILELLNLSDIRSFDLFFGFKLNLCDLHGSKSKADCPAFGNK